MEGMLAEFAERGVVVVPDVFSATEVEEMRAEADYIANISLNAVSQHAVAAAPLPALALALAAH